MKHTNNDTLCGPPPCPSAMRLMLYKQTDELMVALTAPKGWRNEYKCRH